jgi:hypothetical protein
MLDMEGLRSSPRSASGPIAGNHVLVELAWDFHLLPVSALSTRQKSLYKDNKQL